MVIRTVGDKWGIVWRNCPKLSRELIEPKAASVVN